MSVSLTNPTGKLVGINALEIDQLAIVPDYELNAIKIEVINPAGDGVMLLLDAPLVFDTALKLVGAYMRLRSMTL